MTAGKHYRIKTIADAFEKIPASKIDAFLVDLGAMMKHHKALTECLGQLGRAKIQLAIEEGFTWIDDGRHDIKISIEGNGIDHHSTTESSHDGCTLKLNE